MLIYEFFQGLNGGQEECRGSLASAKVTERRPKEDIEAVDVHGRTKLHRECFSDGDVREVQRLLNKGANVNAKDNYGMSPLTLTIHNPNFSILSSLLFFEADVNVRDKGGSTPLVHAAAQGLIWFVQKLIANGANVNGANVPGNSKYVTPLHVASKHGFLRTASMLLKNGADVNAKASRDWTPLHDACENGHEQVVRLLLDKGAEVNVVSNSGQSPLHLASGNGHKEVVRMLLKKGANVDAKTKSGWTSLHYASVDGYEDVVWVLLDNNPKADVNAKDKYDETPLNLAKCCGYNKIVEMMMTAN